MNIPDAVVEKVAEAIYECEKSRSDKANSVLSAATGLIVTGMAIEPWDECAEAFRGDARAALQASGLAEVVEALRSTKLELWHCAKQLAAHGRPGSKGDSVDRALAAARTALTPFKEADND